MVKLAEKSCFVICPIGKDGGATRIRSDKLLKYVIRPILEAKNYSVDRADQLSEPGIITNQIVKRIVECDILIADLTEGNPNVFYELAIRHGIKKPFVHIIDSSEPIPFDNAQVRTIQIDLADLDSVDLAKKELEKQVSTIESDKHVVESPISIAFDLESLKASGNTDQSLLASLYREVLSVKSDVRDLRRQNTKKPLSSKSIRSLEDIYIVLRNEGESDLNELLSKATFHTVEPNNVSLSTSYTVDEDRFIEERLGAVLRRVTGEHWQVDVLPF